MFALLKSIYWPFFSASVFSRVAWSGQLSTALSVIVFPREDYFWMHPNIVVASIGLDLCSQVDRDRKEFFCLCRHLSSQPVMDLSSLEGGNDVTFNRVEEAVIIDLLPRNLENEVFGRFVIEGFVMMKILNFVAIYFFFCFGKFSGCQREIFFLTRWILDFSLRNDVKKVVKCCSWTMKRRN